MNHGWEQPPPPPPQNNNQGWGHWIQQEGELVAENELAAVDQMAEAAVVNTMQHPEHPQHSTSVSSETREFFRAQGPPVTLELPLPATNNGSTNANRVLEITSQNVQSFDSDYQIREMASRLGLHMGFGPSPSVEMLLKEMATIAREAQRFFANEEPNAIVKLEFHPQQLCSVSKSHQCG